MNLISYWIFVAGILVTLASLGSPMDTGWTFYTPYSAKTGAAVTTLSFGLFLVGMSSILTGLNFIVTIHRLRAPWRPCSCSPSPGGAPGAVFTLFRLESLFSLSKMPGNFLI